MKKSPGRKRTPKIPSLTPVKDEAKGYWRVNVPADKSETGTRQRLYFKSKRAADMEAERIKGMASKWGSEGLKIKASLAEDAARAMQILKGIDDATLTSAATFYRNHINERAKSCTVGTLWTDYEEEKEGTASEKYMREIKSMGKWFVATFGRTMVCELEPGPLESAMRKKFKTPAYFNSAHRTIAPAFTRAMQRGLCSSNPLKRIPKDRIKASEVDVFTLKDVGVVLAACRDHTRNENLSEWAQRDCTHAAVPFALLLFCGIRPAELSRLDWTDINIEEKTIRIRATTSKTRQARIIDLEDNLIDWLKTVPADERVGKVVGINWSTVYKAVRTASGIGHRRDTARHSFASYHLAAHGDINATRSVMGHEMGDTLIRHYRAVVTKRDAIKYFSIRPGSTAPQIKATA